MLYNIDFELVSLVVLLAFVCAGTIFNQLRTKQNFLFKNFVYTLLITNALHLVNAILRSAPENVSFFTASFMQTAYLIGLSVLGFWFFCYMVAFVHHIELFSKPYFWIVGGTDILLILMALSNPFTRFIFYYDSVGSYVAGPMYWMVFAVPAFNLCAGLWMALRSYRQIGCKRILLLLLYGSFTALCVLVQYLWLPHVLLVYFGIVCSTLMFYITLERPILYEDTATGLFNREAFSLVISEQMAFQHTFGCIIIDVLRVDAFSSVYGEEMLRALLLKIGEALEKVSNTRADVYRLKHAQFAILRRNCTTQDELVSELRACFREPWNLGTMNVLMHAQFLELCSPRDGATLNDFLRTAEMLSHRAEQCQKTEELFSATPALQVALQRELAVERALERALEHHNVTIYLQPIYDAATESITSAEVLARIIDPELGLISPNEFIPIAERNGSVAQLGEQVFTKTCVFASQSHLFERGIETLQINLSPVEFMQEDLARKLVALAHLHGIEMRRLHLELTESTTAENDVSVRRNLQYLRAAGASFGLDDYGTGYSNLSRIAEYGIESIKIDKSLVWAYFEGENANLEYLLPMFHAEGKRIVAEGVETALQAAMLLSLHCDCLQGYYYARPMPCEDFLAMLSERCTYA